MEAVNATAGGGTATPTGNLKLVLPEVSGWFLPAAIGLVILIAATWNTKARPYVVGLSLLILLGIVLQWGPAIETQTQALLTNLKPASPSKSVS